MGTPHPVYWGTRLLALRRRGSLLPTRFQWVRRDQRGNWTLGIKQEIKDGETLFISRDVYRNFTVTTAVQNYKTFRYWTDAVGGGHSNYSSGASGNLTGSDVLA
jgi:hypothetical protein